jgi:SAM-dependent MidA family methyltransferase
VAEPLNRAADLIRERIRRQGPIRFDDYMELALYAPAAGFYEAGGRAGRDADFLTSPEIGPLFGAVMARALDAWWRALREPDPFVVVEAGAGRGALAASVLAAAPVCATAMRYVLVERSATQRDAQAAVLELETPAHALGPTVPGPDGERELARGTGPVVTSLAELPAGPYTGVVVANELLDNLPFRLLERRDGAWHELRVGEGPDGFELVAVAAHETDVAVATELAPDAPDGGWVPLQETAAAWLRSALALLERGVVTVIDYAATTASLAHRPHGTWLRTYRRHGRGGDALVEPGSQDITSEVAIDQLARVRHPARERSQGEFLAAHGIDTLVDQARAAWEARAHIGDLEALKHRSRIHEAAALIDPEGMGAFRVLEWDV